VALALTLLDELFAAVVPGRCWRCGARGRAVCDACVRTMRPAPNAPPPAPVEWWTACFAYEGVVREIVARAKYRNERAALRVLARALPNAVARAPAPVDVVTFCPASRARYARSGVDHGAFLARTLAQAMGVPHQALLRRDTHDAEQTGRDAAHRRAGPRLHAIAVVPHANILVVDDVATTGGTVAAAARTLLTSGARTVFAATVARTPGPGEARRDGTYTSRIVR